MDSLHWTRFTKNVPLTSFSLEILESISSSVLPLHFLDLFRTHFSTYSSFCTPSCPRRRNLSFFMCWGCLRSYSMLLSWACKTLWDMLCYIVLCKGLTQVDFWCIILNVPAVFLPFEPSASPRPSTIVMRLFTGENQSFSPVYVWYFPLWAKVQVAKMPSSNSYCQQMSWKDQQPYIPPIHTVTVQQFGPLLCFNRFCSMA